MLPATGARSMLNGKDIPPTQEPAMFRRRSDEPHVMLGLAQHEERPDLRDEPDPDPVIEAAAQRLRDQLSSMQPVDSWGRPVPWRQVARIALGDLATSGRVRDAITADAIATVVDLNKPPVEEKRDEPPRWREFFNAVDESDRLLRDEARALPEA